jgi:hypothetical protein
MANEQDSMGWQEITARAKGSYVGMGMSSIGVSEVPGFIKVGFLKLEKPYRSGPRKGMPRWSSGEETFVFITQAEVDVVAKAYETQTGKCRACRGTCTVFASCSVHGGIKTRPCLLCSATGKAIQLGAPFDEQL